MGIAAWVDWVRRAAAARREHRRHQRWRRSWTGEHRAVAALAADPTEPDTGSTPEQGSASAAAAYAEVIADPDVAQQLAAFRQATAPAREARAAARREREATAA